MAVAGKNLIPYHAIYSEEVTKKIRQTDGDVL